LARHVIKLPDIGEGTTEAEIVSWLVKIGDWVSDDDLLAEVMTDKATVEVPSPVAGRVVALNGTVGEKLAVGSELVVLETEGVEAEMPKPAVAPRALADPHPPTPAAQVPPSPASGRGATSGGAKPLYRIAGEGGAAHSDATGEGSRSSAKPSGLSGKPLASPAVRQRAWERGIELQFVPGSGPAGRVTREDLDAYAANGAGAASFRAPALAPRDGVEDVPIAGLRRAIAEHMEAAHRIPHFTYVEEVDVTALEELRAHLNHTRTDRDHLTLLPFLMRAIVNAIVEHPQVNARYDDDARVLHRHRAAHIGIATQTPGGLMVPVVRHAEALDLWQAAAEVQRLSEAARAGKATRDELSGSTITITSLGALGGVVTTPVINRPEVAIIGPNAIVERPVVRDGQIVVRKMMNLSSSFDHRVVDGYDAAEFIQKLKSYLEHPATLFIE
jgi:2-oxoisovalerate dehydrogenase E2 component (dihydrolipoyl transacylase)